MNSRNCICVVIGLMLVLSGCSSVSHTGGVTTTHSAQTTPSDPGNEIPIYLVNAQNETWNVSIAVLQNDTEVFTANVSVDDRTNPYTIPADLPEESSVTVRATAGNETVRAQWTEAETDSLAQITVSNRSGTVEIETMVR